MMDPEDAISSLLPEDGTSSSNQTILQVGSMEVDIALDDLIKVYPQLSESAMKELMVTKLIKGWSKPDMKAHLALSKQSISERKWYDLMRGYWQPFDPVALSRPLNGGYIGNLSSAFDKMLEFYEKQQLLHIPAHENRLIWSVYWDGKTLWGPNELIAWGPRQVDHCHSPTNIHPLVMAHWQGKESFEGLAAVDQQLRLTEWLKSHEGEWKTLIDGRSVQLTFPLVVDWMALIPILNNTAQPSSQPTATTDPCLCGLCGFPASVKVLGWLHDPMRIWKRVAASDLQWKDYQHLFNAVPKQCIWGPFHTNTRCLDTVIHWVLRQYGSAGKPLNRILKECIGRTLSPQTALIIKEVLFRHFHLFHYFNHSHIEHRPKNSTEVKV